MKALKTICNYTGLFVGNIPDIKTYEELKNGQVDWKPYIKPKLEAVTIPYELFERLMNLDKESENNVEVVKAETIKEFAKRFLKIVYDNHYPLISHGNSVGYGMFTIGIEQAINETLKEMVGENNG